MSPFGIYLHVPFCRQKCRYCDFYSAHGGDGRKEAYVRRLIADLAKTAPLAAGYTADSVYFGGGTPTLLSPAQMSGVLQTVRADYSVSPDAEISTECNPATVDEAALFAMREAGVNRLSVGMQSAVDEELVLLGRIHRAEAVKKTVQAARTAGFTNLSLDLMMGIPAQTPASFRQSLETALSYQPQHLSVYSLILEPGTPFYAERDTLPLPDEDTLCQMSEILLETLRAAGYKRYEISNFCLPGYECRHNLHYWHFEDYLGFGPAAHSLWRGRRTEARRDTDAYLAGADIYQEEEMLTPDEAANESVMLGLRLTEGIDKIAFAARFGEPFDARFGARLAPYIAAGFAVDTGTHVYLTDRGLDVSNTILSEILDL